MSNEQFKWNSITYYVDVETGEQIEKDAIGMTHKRLNTIDSTVRFDREKYTKTLLRTVACTKLPAKQLTLWK